MHIKSFIYSSLSVPAVLKRTHPKNGQNRSSTLGPRYLNPMDILKNVLPQEFLQGFFLQLYGFFLIPLRLIARITSGVQASFILQYVFS